MTTTTPAQTDERKILRTMVRGAYDLQELRIQTGLRLCSTFRAKLKTEDDPDDDAEVDPDTLSDEAQSIIDVLKASYRRLTDGIARRRTLPEERGFVGDPLISTFSELVLIDQYIKVEAQESAQFRQMTSTLEKIPIYTEYLRDQRGIGPALAGVLITMLDPHKAPHVSSFWKYCGLDVGEDGRGRSRRKEHLVERAYTDRNGNEAVRLSTTYSPWLKSKLMGALAVSLLRSNSPWREPYDGYKHRLETDPGRVKVTVGEWKKRNNAKEDVTKLWTPGRIHHAALRYMVKMFLAEYWAKWRAMEGLPVTPTYQESKLGHTHRAA